MFSVASVQKSETEEKEEHIPLGLLRCSSYFHFTFFLCDKRKLFPQNSNVLLFEILIAADNWTEKKNDSLHNSKQ